MTKQADFKRRVRARMAKTGESYATARGQLLAERAGRRPAEEWMADALHVSNGDATDLPGTGLAERILYWRDVLHEGPVPAVGAEELRRIRAEFLAGSGADDRGEGSAMFLERDRTLADNRDGEYVLWFEADLYDQLQIIQILDRLADLGVPPQRITLICIGEHPGIARFGGLGELTAEQLRELPDDQGVRAADPGRAASSPPARGRRSARRRRTGCARIAATRSGELRFLGEAFDRLSREYPATRDGLSLTERRVLAAVADGATDAGTAFVRAWARETRPYLGDSWCFAMMDRMAAAPVPLLEADPPGRPVDRVTGLRLTDTGARVLAGEADHVALNGIDRWIGGVHLRGRQVPWRWDDGTESLVRSAATT